LSTREMGQILGYSLEELTGRMPHRYRLSFNEGRGHETMTQIQWSWRKSCLGQSLAAEHVGSRFGAQSSELQQQLRLCCRRRLRGTEQILPALVLGLNRGIANGRLEHQVAP